ncbi:MAG: NUDIX domain-containing protein [Patescibacteria group bacterium]
MVNIYFFTSTGEIIFQHRAKDKDIYPDLLDTTVGGHVEMGMSVEDTAVQEIREETGLTVSTEQLIFIRTFQVVYTDARTGRINNDLKTMYAYHYNGDIKDLQVEEGEGIGFEAWPIEKLLTLGEADKKRFVPVAFSPEGLEIFWKIQELV